MTIRFDDVHAIRVIAHACMIQFVPRIHHCIAEYDSNDRLTGGGFFTDYWGNGGSCQIHMAGFNPRWITRPLLYLAFDYPFNQLGVQKLFGLVPERNHKARNINLKLGFRIEYLAEGVFNHKDDVNGMYLMSMTRDECRWLKMKMPYIEFAPPERTNTIDLPLAALAPVGMMQ